MAERRSARGGTPARRRGTGGIRCPVESAAAVLTDYHLHLRPDDDDTPARTTSRPATPSATARSPRSAGSQSSASRSTSTASPSRSTSGSTRGGVRWAHDDVDAYCEFVREETDLRLGIEADFVAGAEDRIANFLEAREWDYVVGSVHFLADDAVDMDDSACGVAASRRRGLEALLRDARRGRAQRALRHHRPPRPGEGVGGDAPHAAGRPAPLLRGGHRGLPRRRGRGRGLDRGAAQAGRRDLPGPARSSR